MDLITVENLVEAPIDIVWASFTLPEHICNWYFATPDWHAPRAENDLRVGGRFLTRMEAKDGSFGFDFEGIYTDVVTEKMLRYELADGRYVVVNFDDKNGKTLVTETFVAETENPLEMQRAGWQAILDNFKNYTEDL